MSQTVEKYEDLLKTIVMMRHRTQLLVERCVVAADPRLRSTLALVMDKKHSLVELTELLVPPCASEHMSQSAAKNE